MLQSIDLILMVVIGGWDRCTAPSFGAIFVITPPQVIALAKDLDCPTRSASAGPAGRVYGVVLIAFVLFEPLGLYGRWLKMRTWFQLFPVLPARHVQAPEVVPEIGPAEMRRPVLFRGNLSACVRRRAGGQQRQLRRRRGEVFTLIGPTAPARPRSST